MDVNELPNVNALIDSPNKFSSDPFIWFSGSQSDPSLSLGVTTPSPADLSKLLAETGSDGAVDGIPVQIIDLPTSLVDLRETRDKVLALAEDLGVGVATELRPDIGRVVVTVSPGEVVEARAALEGDLGCVVAVESGDTYEQLLISRADMPPYKGGKRIHIFVFVQPNTYDSECSTGFVFEEDGSGQRPLFGSTAGHCVQGNMIVTDDTPEGTFVGETVGPNLFFASSPADGDSVQIDLGFTRANGTTKVIVTDSSEVTVIGHIAPINLGMGTVVCASGGVTANAWCGGMSRFDVSLQGVYFDFASGQNRTKTTNNKYCFTGTEGRPGDSGTAVYRVVAPNQAKAVGILSGETSVDSCFTSTVLLGGRTNSHVWTGD